MSEGNVEALQSEIDHDNHRESVKPRSRKTLTNKPCKKAPKPPRQTSSLGARPTKKAPKPPSFIDTADKELSEEMQPIVTVNEEEVEGAETTMSETEREKSPVTTELLQEMEEQRSTTLVIRRGKTVELDEGYQNLRNEQQVGIFQAVKNGMPPEQAIQYAKLLSMLNDKNDRVTAKKLLEDIRNFSQPEHDSHDDEEENKHDILPAEAFRSLDDVQRVAIMQTVASGKLTAEEAEELVAQYVAQEMTSSSSPSSNTETSPPRIIPGHMPQKPKPSQQEVAFAQLDNEQRLAIMKSVSSGQMTIDEAMEFANHFASLEFRDRNCDGDDGKFVESPAQLRMRSQSLKSIETPTNLEQESRSNSDSKAVQKPLSDPFSSPPASKSKTELLGATFDANFPSNMSEQKQSSEPSLNTKNIQSVADKAKSEPNLQSSPVRKSLNPFDETAAIAKSNTITSKRSGVDSTNPFDMN